MKTWFLVELFFTKHFSMLAIEEANDCLEKTYMFSDEDDSFWIEEFEK